MWVQLSFWEVGLGLGCTPSPSSVQSQQCPLEEHTGSSDVPMSNCINSGISKIYILTQFNSTSLNRHLARCVQPSPQQDRIWVQEHSARCRTASCVHAEGLPQLTHLERRAMAVQDIQCGLWGAVWG